MAAGTDRYRRSDVARTVRLVAEEMPGGLHLALWWYGHDDEGMTEEGQHLTATVQLPLVDEQLDHAWLVLVTACHMLEEAGSVGRVGGMPPRRWPREGDAGSPAGR